ncbi:MAG: type I-C CRISPR-associated protein Cas8c/Csd1 [Nitrospirota bacterium]
MDTYLNPEHPHPAYHCGRLLAVLARLQRDALGDVGAGIVQRYYSAASQTVSRIVMNSFIYLIVKMATLMATLMQATLHALILKI